jgi:excisionase family DNA binding protein
VTQGQWLTVTEAADELGVDVVSVVTAIATRELRAIRDHGRFLISRPALRIYTNAHAGGYSEEETHHVE